MVKFGGDWVSLVGDRMSLFFLAEERWMTPVLAQVRGEQPQFWNPLLIGIAVAKAEGGRKLEVLLETPSDSQVFHSLYTNLHFLLYKCKSDVCNVAAIIMCDPTERFNGPRTPQGN